MRSHSASEEEAKEKAQKLSLAGVAPEITCPLYIVAGKLDRLISYTDAERLAAEASGPVELLVMADRLGAGAS